MLNRNSISRRGSVPDVPAPMRVSELVIERCGKAIESRSKTRVRGVYNRLLKLKNGLFEIGVGFQLSYSVEVPKGSRLGRFGYIGHGFFSESPISVGDLCMISTGVSLIANDHGIDDQENPIRLAFRWEHHVTVFESDVWVGHGATFRSGITVGRGSVVAAGAIVTKNVPPYTVVAGNPARPIKSRFEGQVREIYEAMLYQQ